jgi:predicted DNA-binding transcriptional regulator AlpA
LLPTFIRFRQLKDRRIANSWAQLRGLQERSGFPLGRLIGNLRCWTEQEVSEWLESRPIDGLSLKGVAKTRSEAKEAREAEHGTA